MDGISGGGGLVYARSGGGGLGYARSGVDGLVEGGSGSSGHRDGEIWQCVCTPTRGQRPDPKMDEDYVGLVDAVHTKSGGEPAGLDPTRLFVW